MKRFALIALALAATTVARALTVGEYLAVQHAEAVRCAAAYSALQEQFLQRAQSIELIAVQLRGQLGATYQGNDLAEFLALFGPAPVVVTPAPVQAAVVAAPKPAPLPAVKSFLGKTVIVSRR